VRGLYSKIRKRLPALEASALATIGLVGASLWLFISIAGEVLEGETSAWDRRLLLALRSAADPAVPWGPAWAQEMARDFTALGGVAVLTLMTLAVTGYLLLARKRHAAVAVFVAVAGGLILSSLLKLGFDRPRPDLVPHGSYVYTASFPSGHSMMAAVTYLTLGAMLARVQASAAMSRGSHAARRSEPRVSRRALANRRRGRVGGRRRVGAALLASHEMAAKSRPGRAPRGLEGPPPAKRTAAG